ncbi:MAG: ABC transporter permease [Propionibacteriaceae bacterium]|jgi:hypothetical protein|nr:ABC transporter permease [Propionibacteriaceae bacterium]
MPAPSTHSKTPTASTFVTTLKVLVRERSMLVWTIAFPLVLTTLIFVALGGLDTAYELKPVPVLVVADSGYTDSSMSTLVDELSTGDNQILAPTKVATTQQAEDKLEAGGFYGYITVENGEPHYTMDSRKTSSNDPSQSIVLAVLDQYKQTADTVAQIAKTNPSALTASFMQALQTRPAYTEQYSVSANPPSDSLRYMYATLAFSVVMMSGFATTAVISLQPTASPLAARRAVAGKSKASVLFPTLAACWLLSYLCLIVGYLYQRVVFGISFGGKDLAANAVLAVGAGAMTMLGAFLGALKIPNNAKSGLVAFLSCFLALFAGMYGPFSQDLGNQVEQAVPLLSALNPARTVSQAFMSLYYYDDYSIFGLCIAILAGFAAVFFLLTAALMRRNRYASL